MHSSIVNKIVQPEHLQRLLSAWRLKSNRIVFTNGVFDLIHPGHIDYLNNAADLGHRLVVGVNSDQSVKTLGKGDSRPINPEWSRACIVAALRCVDAVVIFDSPTPESLITEVLPEVLAKGGDYDAECIDTKSPTYIVGSQIVRKNGGKVVSIPFLEGYSSTAIIDKILRNG
jgi:rfaE bifunctional protein nucleotidyltransferase chain/domain